MIPIIHKVNSIEKLNSLPDDVGIEIDIRFSGKELVLSHDIQEKEQNFEEYLEKINKKNIYKLNYHEGFSIYTIYDLILAGTINDIDPSIFRNLLQKKIN